ncbi:MAG TPA: FliI/YscN family ATPase [Spirochaetota bacterium]|nr:FliI/YscN family ATPase [Spirochaetota bacterium]
MATVNDNSRFTKYSTLLDQTETIRSQGIVKAIKGLIIESQGPICQIGEVCELFLPDRKTVRLEVIGFSENRVQLTPLENAAGITPGCKIFSTGRPLEIMVGDELKGRILNGIGKPLDHASLNFFKQKLSVFNLSPDLLRRKQITEKMVLGIKAIDGPLTVAKGQRLGIFSGSGVGKSTLLSMIARNSEAGINVIALVGERGREVRDFIEKTLGPEGMKRSIIVVATSDQPPMARIRCAYTAISIAEYFRDKGNDVIFMMDSITRLAMAQREISISLGETPTARGYSPSVFDLLPKILERAGTSAAGTITGFFNVLVEGDDMDEPISDAVRGILDGHIVLSRKMAARNYYPAIDICQSISRLMTDVCEQEHLNIAAKLKELISSYQEMEDLINIGAYISGSNNRVDEAIKKMPRIESFLQQKIDEKIPLAETMKMMQNLFPAEKQAGRLNTNMAASASGEEQGKLKSLQTQTPG